MVYIRCDYVPFKKLGSYFTPEYKNLAKGLKGIITSISFSGHAGVLTNNIDVACAGISAVAIGYSKAIATNCKLRSSVRAAKAGELDVKLLSIDANSLLWLIGLQSGLVLSLEAIKKEYPQACNIKWSSTEFFGFCSEL